MDMDLLEEDFDIVKLIDFSNLELENNRATIEKEWVFVEDSIKIGKISEI